MAGNALAMLPWFPRDFIAATRHWHLFERAVYRELLDAQWEMGTIPDDDERLARLVGLSPKEFAPLWAVVREKFVAADGGGLINIRLEEHRAKALQIREVRASAGRNGGKASVQAKRQATTQANPEAKPGSAEPKINYPSPSPSPDIPPPPSGVSPLPGGAAPAGAQAGRVSDFPRPDRPRKPEKRERRGPLSHRVPADFQVPDAQADWAKREFPALDLYAETQKFRDHEFAVARSDWLAAWRNWMRRAAEKPPSGALASGRR